jgi:hypothetical protein
MNSTNDLVEQPETMPPGPAPLPPSLTIPEFCAGEQISEATYHKLRRDGLGPREMRYPGLKVVRISIAARDAWREMMENPTGQMKKRIDADLKARSERLRAAGKRGAASPKHPCRKRRAR